MVQALSDVVFRRASKAVGSNVLFQQTLPAPLYALLQAVDGKSPVSRYALRMTSLAPVPEKFEQLELRGYATRQTVSLATEPTAGCISQEDLLDLASAVMQTARSPDDQGPKENLHTKPALISGLAALQFEKWAVAADNRVSPASAEPLAKSDFSMRRGSGLTALQTPVLADIIVEMQSFLNRFAGMEGLPLALMLEKIVSLEQLRLELPDYLTLIKPFGPESNAHARHLQALLDTTG